MAYVCPKCLYLGDSNYRYHSKYLDAGFVIIVLGAFLFVVHVLTPGSSALSVMLTLIIIASGVYIIYMNRQGRICSKCNFNGVLSTDTADALDLIKKYDLEPGDNTNKRPISTSPSTDYTNTSPFQSPK